MKNLWGGRFSGGVDPQAWEFNASIGFDIRLSGADIKASAAWAMALEKANVISSTEKDQIIKGLEKIYLEFHENKFEVQPTDEDIHTAVERRLTEIVGPLGGKLHTGRSRNDQVATDFTLWILNAIKVIDAYLKTFQSTLMYRAKKDMGILMSGYTHLQQSQPILLSHWWLSHFWPLARDRQRLGQLYERASVLPLGSGAMAGTPYPIDREFLAAELDVKAISPNSIDAVSNRDTAVEFLFIASLIGVHLSRLSEALILFSTAEFGYISLSDAYTTGSSLMPQKRNPDTLELTRGKAGTIIGRLCGLLTTLKGLPSTYDKDLQEDKVPVFEVYDNLRMMLSVMPYLLETLEINTERMQANLNPAILATDLADYLVAKGIPFRQAHELVGKVVRLSEEKNIPMHELPLEDYQSIHADFSKDVYDVFDFEKAIAKRALPGGTGEKAVREQLSLAKTFLYQQQ